MHVGNTYDSNMALLQNGIRALLYDQTMGDRDKNYHPSDIIFQGNSVQIAPNNILTTHSCVYTEHPTFGKEFPVGAKLSQCHLALLKLTFPYAKLLDYSTYLKVNQADVSRIVKVITENNPQLFTRHVDKDGNVEEISGSGYEVKSRGVFGVNREDSGFLLPNNLNIIINTVLDAIAYKTDLVYHLSGPDMVKYIGKEQEILDGMYETLKAHPEFSDILPKQLKFILVPTASAKLVTTMDRKVNMDKLVSCILELKEIDAQRRIVMKKISESGNMSQIAEKSQEFTIKKQELIQQLRQAIIKCPESIRELKDGNFLTQFDVSQSGIYIPNFTQESTFEELERVNKLIQDNK